MVRPSSSSSSSQCELLRSMGAAAAGLGWMLEDEDRPKRMPSADVWVRKHSHSAGGRPQWQACGIECFRSVPRELDSGPSMVPMPQTQYPGALPHLHVLAAVVCEEEDVRLCRCCRGEEPWLCHVPSKVCFVSSPAAAAAVDSAHQDLDRCRMYVGRLFLRCCCCCCCFVVVGRVHGFLIL